MEMQLVTVNSLPADFSHHQQFLDTDTCYYMCRSALSGRRPAFNFQCLKPQRSLDDQLPIPGNYRGNISPSRSRLQVKNRSEKQLKSPSEPMRINFAVFS